jgi:thiol-disulfide isomerase/thioredoxin
LTALLLRLGIPALLLLALLLLVVPGLVRTEPAFEVAGHEPTEVPEIAFQNAAGETVALADFRGKVVVLNLWATWCAPCKLEMPSLDRLQAELGGPDLHVVALSVDRAGADKVASFLKDEIGAEHLELYRDPEAATSRALGVLGLPTTVILDREGREVGRALGHREWDTEAAKDYLRAVMAR